MEEFQVPGDGGIFFLRQVAAVSAVGRRFVEDGLAEGRGGGIPRRVLINVEGRVEVGDAAPFAAQFGVDEQVRPVIGAVAFAPV